MDEKAIQALQQELQKIRKDIVSYTRESLADDGLIDEEEQAELDKMEADIARIETKLEALKQQEPDTMTKITQWLREHWTESMTEQEAVQQVKQKFTLMLRDEAIIQAFQTVSAEKQTGSAPVAPKDPQQKKGNGIGDKIGKFLKIKFAYQGAVIIVDIPATALKTQFVVPVGTEVLDLELKISASKDVTFSMKYDLNEKFYFKLKSKYSIEKQTLTSGLYVSNTKDIYEKALPRGINAHLTEQGDALASALNKLQKNPNDEDSQKKAGKAISEIAAYMKYVKATYKKAISFSAGAELVVPLNTQPLVPGGPPQVPTLGFSVILRF